MEICGWTSTSVVLPGSTWGHLLVRGKKCFRPTSFDISPPGGVAFSCTFIHPNNDRRCRICLSATVQGVVIKASVFVMRGHVFPQKAGQSMHFSIVHHYLPLLHCDGDPTSSRRSFPSLPDINSNTVEEDLPMRMLCHELVETRMLRTRLVESRFTFIIVQKLF